MGNYFFNPSLNIFTNRLQSTASTYSLLVESINFDLQCVQMKQLKQLFFRLIQQEEKEHLFLHPPLKTHIIRGIKQGNGNLLSK